MFSDITIIALLVAGVVLVYARTTPLPLTVFYVVYSVLPIFTRDDPRRFTLFSPFQFTYIVLGIATLIKFLADDRHFLRHAGRLPLWPYLALLLVNLVSASYSLHRGALKYGEPGGLSERLLILLVFAFAAAQIRKKHDLLVVCAGVVAVGLFMAGWAIFLARALGFAADRGGVGFNENYISYFVYLGILPLLELLFLGRKLAIPAAAAILIGLYATFILASRGATGAAALAAVFMLCRHIAKRRVIIPAVAVLLIGLGAWVALSFPGSGNIAERIRGRDRTMGVRVKVWREILGVTEPERILVGCGLGCSIPVISAKVPGVANAHNIVMGYLMEQGLIGAFALLAFLCAVGKRIQASASALKGVFTGWFVFLVAFGMTATVTDDKSFWLVCGLICGTHAFGDRAATARVPTKDIRVRALQKVMLRRPQAARHQRFDSV